MLLDFEKTFVWKDCVCRLAPCTEKTSSKLAKALLTACAQDKLGPSETLGTLCYKENGQPFFDGNNGLFVSVSHCGGWVAAAAARTPIGIDIEQPKSYDKSFMLAVCSNGERQRLACRKDSEREFCKLWTKKESAAKCSGDGLKSTKQLQNILETGKFDTKTWEPSITLTIARRRNTYEQISNFGN